MLDLFLIRHGNTFTADQTPIWVGAAEDLPLVDKGREQAKAIGAAFLQAGITPARAITGPLQRTRETASMIMELAANGRDYEVDQRLTEIHYGAWGGRNDEEIIAQYGKEVLDLWNKKSLFPPQAGWAPDISTIHARIHAIAAEIVAQPHSPTLIISSNGILRFFLELIPNAFAKAVEEQQFKMKTGHVSWLQYNGQDWHIKQWNVPPSLIFVK
ncbi:MAG: histidine phosphatase family protein [Alphaproteobacteria bacterium]